MLPPNVVSWRFDCFPAVKWEYTSDLTLLWLLRVPWTARSNQSILQENQPLIFIGRTNAEAATPILWPPDAKSHLTGKEFDAGKDWEQKKNGVAEDEIIRENHQLSGHESEQTLGNSEGQEILECHSSWGYKELDMTE